MNKGFLFAAPLLGLLAACGTDPKYQVPEASPEVISQSAYRHSGPPRLTLFTMVSNSTGSGAHTSLMVNGSQRVIFDPAGTLRSESLIERDDVIYGITPQLADWYTRAHARETYHVVVQEIDVSPAVAERALQLVLSNGTVASAYCAQSTSAILRQLPGFEHLPQTFFPNKLEEAFGTLPNVRERALYEYDDDDKTIALRAYDPDLVLGNQ